MSVLSVIQRHCAMHALAVPAGIIGSTDTQVQQLLALLQSALDDMVVESKFNVVTLECVHQTTAGENQGPMSTLGGGLFGYYQANFETFYDRTLGRPIYGPVSDTEWQELKALVNPGPFPKFRIMGDCLLLNPAPTDPFSIIAFEYMSSFAVVAADGTPKGLIDADTDTFVFPENIIRRWLTYSWKFAKGLQYQEDKEIAFDMLNNYVARDKVKRRINVSEPGSPYTVRPGVYVPSGNWPVN